MCVRARYPVAVLRVGDGGDRVGCDGGQMVAAASVRYYRVCRAGRAREYMWDDAL